jgi:hypothetical protein
LRSHYQAALNDPDLLAMTHEIALTDTRLQELVAEASDWDGISALVEHRRRLVESERKRMVELGQMITAAEATALVLQLLDVVRRHVLDRVALAAMARSSLGCCRGMIAFGWRRVVEAGRGHSVTRLN